MFRSLAKFLVILAAVQVLGGHWAALQSVAWMTMVVDFAQTESLGEAVSKTFDGAHPCEICHVVKEGRQNEGKQVITKFMVKLDAILAPTVELPSRCEAPFQFFEGVLQRHARFVSPLTPPPRLA